MDLMAGLALRAFRKEIFRKLQDRGIFQSDRAPHRPTQPPADRKAYAKFLQENQAEWQRRRRKMDRQNLALVIVCMLLPLILFILGFYFFLGRF